MNATDTPEVIAAEILDAARRGPEFPGDPALRRAVPSGEVLYVYAADDGGMIRVEVVEAPHPDQRTAYATIHLSAEILATLPVVAVEILLADARRATDRLRALVRVTAFTLHAPERL